MASARAAFPPAEREIDCGLFLVSEAYHLGQEETDWFDKPREVRSERVRHYGGHSSSQKRPPAKHTYHDYDELPDEDPWQHDDYPQHREHRHHGDYGRHAASSRHDEQPRRSAKQHPREPGRHESRGHAPPATAKKAQQPEPRGTAPYGPSASEYAPPSRPATHHHGAEPQKTAKTPQPHGAPAPAQKSEAPTPAQQPAGRQQQAGQQAARQQPAARQAAQPAGSAQPRTQGPASSRPPQQQPGTGQAAGKAPAAPHAQPGGHPGPQVSMGTAGSAASPRGRVGDQKGTHMCMSVHVPPQMAPFRRVHSPAPLPLLGLWGHFPTALCVFSPGSSTRALPQQALDHIPPTRTTLKGALLCRPGWGGESLKAFCASQQKAEQTDAPKPAVKVPQQPGRAPTAQPPGAAGQCAPRHRAGPVLPGCPPPRGFSLLTAASFVPQQTARLGRGQPDPVALPAQAQGSLGWKERAFSPKSCREGQQNKQAN